MFARDINGTPGSVEGGWEKGGGAVRHSNAAGRSPNHPNAIHDSRVCHRICRDRHKAATDNEFFPLTDTAGRETTGVFCVLFLLLFHHATCHSISSEGHSGARDSKCFFVRDFCFFFFFSSPRRLHISSEGHSWEETATSAWRLCK